MIVPQSRYHPLTRPMKHMLRYRKDWKWSQMRGSCECLHWSFRDLKNLEDALTDVKDWRACIQAGANVGLFPKRLAESFETVYTFEPDPKLAKISRNNAPEPNIVLANAALGDTHEPVAVSCTRRDSSGRAVHEGLTHVSGPGEIRQLRIDDLGLEHCGLIYLDIEGYELHALRGAAQTIKRCRPVIVAEVNIRITHYGHSVEDLEGFLGTLGYAFERKIGSDNLYLHKEAA